MADQFRARWPGLADLLNASEYDVLAHMAFPHKHRTNLQSTNPIERLNKEVKRRNGVVSFFLNEASMLRLMGAVVFGKNVDWQRSGRDMMVEAFAEVS